MAFKIDSEWMEVEADIRPELDATYGRLGININDAWATEFEAQNGSRGERVEIPAYPLAEWVAENWWALLYEPEKGSGSKREAGFQARHWFGTAREGFAVPDLWLVSVGGEKIEVESHPYFFSHARILMPQDLKENFALREIESSLSGFVSGVVSRLQTKGFEDTLLQQIWSEFLSFSPEDIKLSRLLGALGLSPYASDPSIEELLSSVMSGTSDKVAEDFCEAAEQGDIFEAANDVLRSISDLPSEPKLDLGKLFQVDHRMSNTPWRTGVAAVDTVRNHFGFDAADPQGGDKFLAAIGASPIISARDGYHDIEEPVVHGSLRRDKSVLQMSLIRRRPEARRFDAARACLLAWDQQSDGDRLVTRAKVRDQQASRAFAAELLAPIQYIKKRVSNNLLSVYRANEIAQELSVSPAVVNWQAGNNRIEVVGSRRMTRN